MSRFTERFTDSLSGLWGKVKDLSPTITFTKEKPEVIAPADLERAVEIVLAGFELHNQAIKHHYNSKSMGHLKAFLHERSITREDVIEIINHQKSPKETVQLIISLGEIYHSRESAIAKVQLELVGLIPTAGL